MSAPSTPAGTVVAADPTWCATATKVYLVATGAGGALAFVSGMLSAQDAGLLLGVSSFAALVLHTFCPRTFTVPKL